MPTDLIKGNTVNVDEIYIYIYIQPQSFMTSFSQPLTWLQLRKIITRSLSHLTAYRTSDPNVPV